MPDVRDEIELQRTLDENWREFQGVLDARLHALVGARQAFVGREVGGAPAFRQALLDVASICKLLAAELQTARIR